MPEINNDNCTDFSKENRIFKELKRISVFFEDIAENQKAIIAPLLQNAAFMRITLEDLQEAINTRGVIDVYQNGANQHGTKTSAALQSYNSLVKNYASVIKTLSQMLPPEIKPAAGPFSWIPKPKTQEEIEEELRREEERTRKINDEIARAAEWQRQQREEAQLRKGRL